MLISPLTLTELYLSVVQLLGNQNSVKIDLSDKKLERKKKTMRKIITTVIIPLLFNDNIYSLINRFSTHLKDLSHQVDKWVEEISTY